MPEEKIAEIISDVLREYSYSVSEECFDELVSRLSFEMDDGYDAI